MKGNVMAKRVEEIEEFDTEDNDAPVCPYCGHEEEGDINMDISEALEIECDGCKMTYISKVILEPRYYTYKKPDSNKKTT